SLDEQERLELCFKRHSINDYISFETFTREILCEEAPKVFSKLSLIVSVNLLCLLDFFIILFDAIGGTLKGISYKKLIVALVTLSKGDIEEKCRCKHTISVPMIIA
uniref:Uncharacterized protein n=1 Tax=Romanomermis culicivorax TaxID=13658 RepID=A0A915ICP8_ROMCU